MTASDPSEPLTEPHLATLFDHHRTGLAGAVRAILGTPDDGAEVLQDAFVNALRALRKGHRPADPAAWVFVVTINAARDRRRQLSRRRERGHEDVSEMELAAKDRTPAAQAETTEALEAARDAITRLDDAEKDVFLMRVSGGMTFEATAEALAIPVGTAKSRMRAALARLRRDLGAFADVAMRQQPQNPRSQGRHTR